MRVATSLRDPYSVGEVIYSTSLIWGRNKGYSDLVGKTMRNTPINPAHKTLVLISAGQSNRTSVAPSAFSPLNSANIDNLNIYDGAIYAAADPMLGCSYIAGGFGVPVIGHVMLRVADLFITAGKFDRVIIVPIAIAATSIANWDNDSVLEDRIPAAIRRLAARGITPTTTGVTMAIEWGQGEGDYATPSATYTAALNRIIDRSYDAGFDGRWFVAKQSYANGSAFPNVIAGQIATVDNVDVFLSADSDALIGVNRAVYGGDDTHMSDIGNANLATAIYNAMVASGAPF